MTRPRPTRITWRVKRLRGVPESSSSYPPRRSFCAAPRTPVRMSEVSVIVADPILGDEEVQRGERRDDDEHDPCHRRGVAHVEALESLLVEVEVIEQGRVGWASGSSAEHVAL